MVELMPNSEYVTRAVSHRSSFRLITQSHDLRVNLVHVSYVNNMIVYNVTPRWIGTDVSDVPAAPIFSVEGCFGNMELKPVMFSLCVDGIRFCSDICRCV
jgi:hypothetical protein